MSTDNTTNVYEAGMHNKHYPESPESIAFNLRYTGKISGANWVEWAATRIRELEEELLVCKRIIKFGANTGHEVAYIFDINEDELK